MSNTDIKWNVKLLRCKHLRTIHTQTSDGNRTGSHRTIHTQTTDGHLRAIQRSMSTQTSLDGTLRDVCIGPSVTMSGTEQTSIFRSLFLIGWFVVSALAVGYSLFQQWN